MVKYENGKIYKIECNITGEKYFGSTCNTLSHRKYYHNYGFKKWKDNKYNYISSYVILERGDWDIVLVENYPCKDINELKARERFYIQNNECVNMRVPNRTTREWQIETNYNQTYYEANRKKLSEKAKEYYKKNFDKLKEAYTKIITCECGASIQTNEKARHLRSKKHNDYVQGKIKINKTDKFDCECGGQFTHTNRAVHTKTLKHKTFMKQKQSNIN